MANRVLMGFGSAVALAFLSTSALAAAGAVTGAEAPKPAAPSATTKPRHHVVTRNMAFDSTTLGKQVMLPVKVTRGSGVVEKTGVTCKPTANNTGHSCTNTSHTCSDLANDMASCCGDASKVEKASCSEKAQ